jgi:hypothetical protein
LALSSILKMVAIYPSETLLFLESTWCCNLSTWNWVFLEKSPVAQILRNFPTFYGTRMFISMLTIAHPLVRILSQINPVHISTFYLSQIHLPLMFTSLWWFHFFWVSLQNPKACSLPHTSCMPCPSYPPWLHHSNYTWWRLKVMKVLIIQFSPTSFNPYKTTGKIVVFIF